MDDIVLQIIIYGEDMELLEHCYVSSYEEALVVLDAWEGYNMVRIKTRKKYPCCE